MRRGWAKAHDDFAGILPRLAGGRSSAGRPGRGWPRPPVPRAGPGAPRRRPGRSSSARGMASPSPLVEVASSRAGACVPYYYSARNNAYTVPRAAPFVGKALALAKDVTQGLGPPRAPTPAARVPDREGRAAAPRRALPRTVRSRLECRLFYASHSKALCLPHYGSSQTLRCRGSRASRNPSPTRLKASTARKMARPGNVGR